MKERVYDKIQMIKPFFGLIKITKIPRFHLANNMLP
jgi:hypothetical protein